MGSEPKRTESSHTTEEETGTHLFKIIGYTLKKGRGVGNVIRSGIFTVGGYDWRIHFFPDGSAEANKDYAVVSLVLVSKNAEVRASYDLSLVNQTTGLPQTFCRETTVRVFNSCIANCFVPYIFIPRRNKLECKSAGYIVDDCLKIECTVTVLKESWVETTGDFEIEVPDSYQNILENYSWRGKEQMSHSVLEVRLSLHTRSCLPHGPLSLRCSCMDR